MGSIMPMVGRGVGGLIWFSGLGSFLGVGSWTDGGGGNDSSCLLRDWDRWLVSMNVICGGLWFM